MWQRAYDAGRDRGQGRGKRILQVRGVRPFFSDKFDITKHPKYKYFRRRPEERLWHGKAHQTPPRHCEARGRIWLLRDWRGGLTGGHKTMSEHPETDRRRFTLLANPKSGRNSGGKSPCGNLLWDCERALRERTGRIYRRTPRNE